VTAPIVGPTRPGHLAAAATALDIRLTDEEMQRLEAPYTPRTPTGFE
jgi:aryl-alcohol dehydrogenase-like predicted oxidoreductase